MVFLYGEHITALQEIKNTKSRIDIKVFLLIIHIVLIHTRKRYFPICIFFVIGMRLKTDYRDVGFVRAIYPENSSGGRFVIFKI